jgi:hypothetical protein
MALDCSGRARGLFHRRQSLWRLGTAFAETDLDRANYETTIADLISGQHSDPLRVIMFNPEYRSCRGSSACHCLRNTAPPWSGRAQRAALLDDFIDRHVGKDRQRTLRLAS